MHTPSIVFFGTSEFAVYILEALKKASLLPSLIICTPDMPQGRKLLLTPPPVKIWALDNHIPILQPSSLRKEKYAEILRAQAPTNGWDLFIVASYGKIIPEDILNIPHHKTLNVHPSLLPALRGPSPIESAILEDIKTTGVTIMRLDKEMDHGPILAQITKQIEEWPSRDILEKHFGEIGGELLVQSIPSWIAGTLPEQEQDHTKATYCHKIEKSHACIDLTADPYTNFRKIQAYAGWPKVYFFVAHAGRDMRVVITHASWKDGTLVIEKVIPEGKKEMRYEDFIRGYK